MARECQFQPISQDLGEDNHGYLPLLAKGFLLIKLGLTRLITTMDFCHSRETCPRENGERESSIHAPSYISGFPIESGMTANA